MMLNCFTLFTPTVLPVFMFSAFSPENSYIKSDAMQVPLFL